EDAELPGLVAPRALINQATRWPESLGPPPANRENGAGAAPAVLLTPLLSEVRTEIERARPVFEKLGANLSLVAGSEGRDDPGSEETLNVFLRALGSP